MTKSTAPTDLADETIATVRRWLAESATVKADPSAERLAGVLKDPKGLDFTIGFVDKVVRPEDLSVAGRNLEKLSHSIPAFLPWYLRFAITLGGGFAPLLPWPTVPIARWVLRRMVGHLVIDASPKSLDKTLAGLRQQGIRLNLNLLGNGRCYLGLSTEVFQAVAVGAVDHEGWTPRLVGQAVAHLANVSGVHAPYRSQIRPSGRTTSHSTYRGVVTRVPCAVLHPA